MQTPKPATLNEPSRDTPIWGEYDVVVLGGETQTLSQLIKEAKINID